MAGIPPYNALSSFALLQHERWGELRAPVELRRNEDRLAVQSLGASHLHLDWLDAIYRTNRQVPLYASEEAIFGDVLPDEYNVANELAEQLKEILRGRAVSLYAPLGVGHHVDHLLVLKAALDLRQHGYAVQFYEDYPYAEDEQKVQQAVGATGIGSLQPIVHHLTESGIAARVTAVEFYRSQLLTLFGNPARVSDRIRAYARAVGSGRYAERYWQSGADA